MMNTVGVAEAKKRFSEIMSRVAYNGDRFIIERHGKPMAALVSPEDLERLNQSPEPEGLHVTEGAVTDEEIDEMVAEISQARENAVDRPFSFED